MKLRSAFLFTALSLASLIGCATETDIEESMTDAALAVPSETAEDKSILASADVGYGTVNFHEYTDDDGETVIAISEDIPNTYSNTPLEGLFAAGYTNLEVFIALLPETDPPVSYVEEHARQAKEQSPPRRRGDCSHL